MKLRHWGFLLFSVVVLVFTLGIVGMLTLLSYKPAYDRSDPDYTRFAEMFEGVRAGPYANGGGTVVIDMADLNKGEWTVACLLGGYTSPVETMERLGAAIDETDRARFLDAETSGLRLAEVEEFEVAIAYADLASQAHFIHFEHGVGARGQHLNVCVSKPETELVLPD
jgi:hypothetical protein